VQNSIDYFAVGFHNSSPLAPAEDAKTCKDAFRKPPFSELRLVDYRDMSKLSSVLKPLVGLECSLDEIQDYFTSRGGSVDGRTGNIIYIEVTPMRKFFSTGRVLERLMSRLELQCVRQGF
jgi:hypothetical protein